MISGKVNLGKFAGVVGDVREGVKKERQKNEKSITLSQTNCCPASRCELVIVAVEVRIRVRNEKEKYGTHTFVTKEHVLYSNTSRPVSSTLIWRGGDPTPLVSCSVMGLGQSLDA